LINYDDGFTRGDYNSHQVIPKLSTQDEEDLPPALRQSSQQRRSRRRQISRGIDERINRAPIESDYDFNVGINQ